MLTRKKIGLMGCGVVADYGHIPAILKVPGLELCSIFDPDSHRLVQMQKKYGVRNAFTDSEKFFRSNIEAVSITSPAPCHKQNVLDAAKFGLSVICEKPLGMNKAECHEMIDAMNQAGKTLYSGFCYRFSPCAIKIRDLIKAKAIGEVRSLRLIYNWNAHGKYEINCNGEKIIQRRRHTRMLEGGPMVDCGTHQIDLAMFWLDSEVVSYFGHGAWLDSYEAPDHMWLHLNHSNGAHTVIEISYSYNYTSKEQRMEFVYEIIGTEGVIRYDREEQSFTMRNSSGTYNMNFDAEKSFEGMYEEWSKALHIGKSCLLTTAQASVEVVDIAREATNEAINKRWKKLHEQL